MARDTTRPIVIKRIVEEAGHAHHGGAWKVAYADFVTAMMAFFLMLWLLSTSSEDTLKGLAEYFSEANANTGTPGGVGGVLQGVTLLPEMVPRQLASPLNMQPTLPSHETRQEAENFALNLGDGDQDGRQDGQELTEEAFAKEARRREQQRYEAAEAAIRQAIASNPELAQLTESLAFDQTPDGLRIQILDRDNYAMFPLGGAQMFDHTRKLLGIVAQAIRAMPNKLSIRGHTDARPFAAGAVADNWTLSSDRANATRRALVEAGLDRARLAEVVGRADAEHLIPADPNDPRNRRISLVLLHEPAAKAPAGAAPPSGAPAVPPPPPR